MLSNKVFQKQNCQEKEVKTKTDYNWIEKSSRIKNNLYKRWITSRNPVEEENYKKYKATYRRVSDEAEVLYYREKFDTHINSAKQLWNNLNTVCCVSSRKQKSYDISKLTASDNVLTKPSDTSNELNSYFSSIDEKLVNKLASNHAFT